MLNTIEECRSDPKLKYIKELLENTGVHGGLFEYKMDSGLMDSGIYFVGTIGSIEDLNIKDRKLSDMARNIEGNPKTFYPYEFAVKITDEDPLVTFDKISEFCRNAEMLKVYCKLENVTPPKEIPIGEMYDLQRVVANSRNMKISGDMREAVQKDLKQAVREIGRDNKTLSEKISSTFKKKEQKLADFIKEYKEVNYEAVHEKYIDDFVDFLKRNDPNLEYIISDPITVDTGIEEVEKGHYDPYGHALKTYQYRDVYFKRADEQIFMDALNYCQYSHIYGKGHDIAVPTLAAKGPVCSVQIPKNYMWLVDHCLNKWNVPYAIDYGCMTKTNDRCIPVLYLEKDSEIIDGMTKDLCGRYARESYVHAWDKKCYVEKHQAEQAKEVKKEKIRNIFGLER